MRPIEVDLNIREAAVFVGISCSSTEADGNAEIIGDHGNDEVGGQTNEQLNEGHGKDVVGGPDNVSEARALRISNDPGHPTRREVEEHMPLHWPCVQTLRPRKVCRKSSYEEHGRGDGVW